MYLSTIINCCNILFLSFIFLFLQNLFIKLNCYFLGRIFIYFLTKFFNHDDTIIFKSILHCLFL